MRSVGAPRRRGGSSAGMGTLPSRPLVLRGHGHLFCTEDTVLFSHFCCRTALAWPGRSKKVAATRTGAPGSFLFLRGILHIRPHRSEPCLPSGNNSCCLMEMAHVWTWSPRYPCTGTPNQPGQHWLSRGPSTSRPQGKGAPAGPSLHPSFPGPHALSRRGPRGPA